MKWERLSAEQKVEAVRPLEAEGEAISTIVWKLKAPKAEITRICAQLRRENEFQAKASEDNGATVPQDELREAADSVAGEASRLGAGRTASATSEHGRDRLERQPPNSPETATEKVGGVASACSALAAGSEIPERRELDVNADATGVTAGETAPKFKKRGAVTGAEIAAGKAAKPYCAASPLSGEPSLSEKPATSSQPVTAPERATSSQPAPVIASASTPLPVREVIDPAPSIEMPVPGDDDGQDAVAIPVARPGAPEEEAPKPAVAPRKPQASQPAADPAAPAIPDNWDWQLSSSTEKHEIVARLTVDGLTADTIARLLGAPSRNAVLGVRNRARAAGTLKIKLHPTRTPAVTPAGSRVQRAPRPMQPEKPRSLPKPVPTEPVFFISSAAAFDPIPGTTPITLAEFGPFTCKWCVDGFDGPSRLFCGQPKDPDESWCAAHRRLAYSPPTSRDRREIKAAEGIA